MSSNIKKFRIKSYKKNNSILKLEKISLKFGNKTILDSLNLNLNYQGLFYYQILGKSFQVLKLNYFFYKILF